MWYGDFFLWNSYKKKEKGMKNLLLMMMFCALKGLYIKKQTITPNNTTSQKDTQILTFKDGFFFWEDDKSST